MVTRLHLACFKDSRLIALYNGDHCTNPVKQAGTKGLYTFKVVTEEGAQLLWRNGLDSPLVELSSGYLGTHSELLAETQLED